MILFDVGGPTNEYIYVGGPTNEYVGYGRSHP